MRCDIFSVCFTNKQIKYNFNKRLVGWILLITFLIRSSNGDLAAGKLLDRDLTTWFQI